MTNSLSPSQSTLLNKGNSNMYLASRGGIIRFKLSYQFCNIIMENENQHQIPEQPLLDEGENSATFFKCIEFMKKSGIPFKHFSHKPVKTSEEAAKERGVDVNTGAKALLVKYTAKEGGDKYALLVMSAGRKVSWKEVKQHLNSKNVTFAKVEEVMQVAGCIPGAVPPFGSVFGVPTLVDPSLEAQGDIINFNCGLRSQSLTMKTKDYLSVEKPAVFTFTTA